MARVLIVDDTKELRDTLVEHFEDAGHTCFEAADGIDALNQLKHEKIDIVILDMHMPRMDGKTTYTHIKEIQELSETPVIFLTADKEDTDVIAGLTMGADDYITKPCNPQIIVKKSENLLRLAHKEVKKDTITVGDLCFDKTAGIITQKGVEIALTPTEFKLLCFFMYNPNQLISHEQLVEAVWGYAHEVAKNTVAVNILRINTKLDKNSYHVQSERGRGYRLATPHTEEKPHG